MVCDAELIIPRSQLQDFEFLKVEISGPTALEATFGFEGNVIQKDEAIRSIELIDVGPVGNGYGYDGFPYTGPPGGYGYDNGYGYGYGSGPLRFLYRIIIETGPMDGGDYFANLLLFSRYAGEEPLVSEPDHFTVVLEEPESKQLAFVEQPGNAEAGSPFGTQPVVEIQDEQGNQREDDNSTQVTLAIFGDTGIGAVLSGTLTRTAVDGLVTFTDLSIDLAGAGYVLTASAPDLAAAFSQPFDVAAPLGTASGVALLEGRALAHNEGIDVDLFRGNVPVDSTTTTASGAFDFDNLEPGGYRVEASTAGWLRETREFDINSNTDLGLLLLPAGDADASGHVDRNDLQLFQRGLNRPPWPGVHTDVDDGGTVSLEDMIYAAKNLGRGVVEPPSRIAFASDREGNFEIYTMNPDGSDQTRITNRPTNFDCCLDWSPDGKRIAFESQIGFDWEVFVMDDDGSNVMNISNNSAFDGWPSWSSDGRIAFFSNRGSGDHEIHTMNPDGSGLTQLTDNSRIDRFPSWSPDSSMIAFRSDRAQAGNEDIWIMKDDGTGAVRLTTHAAEDTRPEWSPDGTTIAFVSKRHGNEEVYTIKTDGTNLRRLTDDGAEDDYPDWAPDSSKIVFASDRGSRPDEVYIMDADGMAQTRITTNQASDRYPAWSPGSVPAEIIPVSTSSDTGQQSLAPASPDGPIDENGDPRS